MAYVTAATAATSGAVTLYAEISATLFELDYLNSSIPRSKKILKTKIATQLSISTNLVIQMSTLDRKCIVLCIILL